MKLKKSERKINKYSLIKCTKFRDVSMINIKDRDVKS
jgi:hypothetical protein